MIDFSEAYIENLTIHRVGNKYNMDGYIISDKLCESEPEIEDLLLSYFTKPFTKYMEVMEFTHTSELSLNEVYMYASAIFDEDNFVIQSANIIKHLYNQSEHQHIKAGDVFITEIGNIYTEEGDFKGLGIFKAEDKDKFFNFKGEKELELVVDKGIYTKKLDKGCLILNSDRENGYKVYSIDSNSYDAEYWKNHFLNVQYKDGNTYRTSNTMKLFNKFADDVIKQELGSKEKVNFLSETVRYFEEKEKATFDELTACLDHTLKGEFNSFRNIFEEKNEIKLPDEFEISPIAVEHQKKKFKSQIKLDTNITINIDFKSNESFDKFIERGWDDDKQMHFYKVYYDHEK